MPRQIMPGLHKPDDPWREKLDGGVQDDASTIFQ